MAIDLPLIIQRIKAKSSGFRQITRKYDNLAKKAKRLGMSSRQLAMALKKENKVLNENNKIVNASTLVRTKNGKSIKSQVIHSNAMIKANKNLVKSGKGFRGQMLSMMFVGMAVVGFFSAYTSEANSLMGVNEELVPSLGGAVAAFWEFMKLDKLVENITKFADENQLLVGGLITLAVILGTVAMLFGMLGMISFSMLLAELAGVWTIFGKIGISLGGLAILAAAFLLIWEGLKIILDPASTLFDKIMGVIMVIAGIAAVILFFAVGWVAALIAVGVGIVAWLLHLKPVKDFFMWLGEKIKNIGKAIKDFVVGKIGRIFGFGGGDVTPFAEGGIVTRPTRALIGEAGPEAVIPLSKLANFAPQVSVNANVSNNVDINVLADRLSSIYSQQLRSMGIGRTV
jgi:hypothetical protein